MANEIFVVMQRIGVVLVREIKIWRGKVAVRVPAETSRGQVVHVLLLFFPTWWLRTLRHLSSSSRLLLSLLPPPLNLPSALEQEGGVLVCLLLLPILSTQTFSLQYQADTSQPCRLTAYL